ncbi:MAG: transcriptional regulator, MerR family [Polaromonas sp.]|nr:transcriptional regulator, MerR family [Polaromonas sp.]
MNTPSMHTRITGFILEEQTELTLADLSRACAADTTLVIELVDEGVLSPVGDAPEQWRFTGVHMQRARTALSLQRDLGINLAGAALALELLDELARLRAQMKRLAPD